ncbi:MAG: MBL fold metallo-hydrolase [Gammaproteobacteria bacterium]|nr:MBL fold metallo-hydrolase [Gammaproteobacteria bacterium]MYF01805.1 MBL fold metallo-hydrolase [Gammaproteobacteria bacterium]MYI76445.1 MBL fold metallo-hydrolase [Gammaproteobacteria bacterium]
MEFTYGLSQRVSPRIRRVVAHNPSPFTYFGTGTYLVGSGRVAVIDPGPADPGHIDSILLATQNEEITHLVVTHTHLDHSPGCALLKEHCEAKTYGYGPHGANVSDDWVVEEGCDTEFVPDVEVRHHDVIMGKSWSLICVHTPGHTSNHVCYILNEEKALFSGDHVMGWSTSVISPPDGDMESYMASLRLLLEYELDVYWPTHGPPITDPVPYVEAFIQHRLHRERQIVECCEKKVQTISELVPLMYENLDPILYPAARRSVYAAVRFMVKKGLLRTDGPLNEDSRLSVS